MNMEILGLFLGPIIAVGITLWWQQRKEKRDAKRNLFMTLMAHRRAYPPTIEWVNALNLIDVVFAGHESVVDLWHDYYEELMHAAEPGHAESLRHAHLQMLSEMARVMGYKRLQQTDIDKYYSPVAHGNQLELNYKTQQEFLRVLESTSRFETEPLSKTEQIAAALAGADSKPKMELPPPNRPRGSLSDAKIPQEPSE